MENTQTRIIRYSTINFIGWIVSLTVTLLSVPFFISKISSDGYGIWVLVGSLTGYFSLLQLGIGPAVIKYIAQFHALNDEKSVCDVINAALLFSLFVGIIAGIVIYFLSPFFVSLFHLPTSLYVQSLMSFRTGAIFYPVFLVSNVYVSVFIGYQHYVISNGLNITQISLTSIIGGILLVLNFGVVGLVIAGGIVDIVCIIVGQYLLYKMVKHYELKLSGALSMLRKMFRYSIYVFISQLSQVINARLAELIIGIVIGPSAVTFFNIPSRLIGYFSSGASSISAVLFPFASELQAGLDTERIKRTFLMATRYFTFLIVPFYFFVMVYSKSILMLWLSDEIAKESYKLMILYSIAYLIANMTTIPSQFLQGFGRVKFISQFSIGVLFVSLIAYYPLTKHMGIIGAGFAMLTTQIFGLIFIYYALKVLNISLREYISANGSPFLFGFISLLFSILFTYLAKEYISSVFLSFTLSFSFFSGFYYLLCASFSEMGTVMRKYYSSFVRR